MLDVRALEAARGGQQVLWGVSWHVREGEVVGVVGPNGAGKSTTLLTVAGLLRPLGGEVWMAGERVDGLSPAAVVERGLALVPEGRRLFSRMSVLDNLLLGGYTARARARRRQTLEEVFALFPVLSARRSQLAGTLSGGEQQMLAFGRALMSQPRILLLDEPTLGLAPVIAGVVFETVRRIARTGVAVVVAEQSLVPTLRHVDRGYVMARGRVLAEGDSADLLSRDEVRRTYVGR
ncbi:MAG: ABC transporter ATP-binding protein [Armatimonadota bacterium]|nr:ABC transporter ATP-binding protein [Armatimonadota bacterium]MDR7460781.1 ABC transporter ATP-binding protein [Armatimonadota bacterium]MDR7559650.1 ABC transporter ATP-binding protein [Armatimonadota bacterium]MDR7577117.1 ABC transporter ATP-binding protein [Armatimonadota bacterium]